MKRHVEWIILLVFVIAGLAGVLLEWRAPAADGTGLAVSESVVDLLFKIVFTTTWGLWLTRSYPWRVRPLFAALAGGAFFVMIATAAHLPLLRGRAIPTALALLVAMAMADFVWRRGQRVSEMQR